MAALCVSLSSSQFNSSQPSQRYSTLPMVAFLSALQNDLSVGMMAAVGLQGPYKNHSETDWRVQPGAK